MPLDVIENLAVEFDPRRSAARVVLKLFPILDVDSFFVHCGRTLFHGPSLKGKAGSLGPPRPSHYAMVLGVSRSSYASSPHFATSKFASVGKDFMNAHERPLKLRPSAVRIYIFCIYLEELGQ